MTEVLLINNNRYLRPGIKTRHIYFGSEFCGHLLPGFRDIKNLDCLRKKYGIEFSVVTPYVNETHLNKVGPLLTRLDSDYPGTEVIINDWGVFNLVRKKHKTLKPVLGRLLSRQKRGFFTIVNKKIRDIHSIKLSPEDTVYLSSSILQNDAILKFLSLNGIDRIGLDCTPFGALMQKTPLNIDLYYPYTYITTTNYCLTAMAKPKNTADKRIDVCGKPCLTRRPKQVIINRKRMILYGNTQFYINKGSIKKLLPLINRLVIPVF